MVRLLLTNWTQRGINTIKDTISDRYISFKASVEKAGGKLTGAYWETVMSLMLKVGSAGNGRTKTLKAFTAEEGMKIIKDLA
jgi:uncharacterized protein with GYD domain